MLNLMIHKLFDLSLVGSYSIIVVLLCRLFLRKCDRKYSYYLWFVVFINLCIPFSFKSAYSLVPRQLTNFSTIADTTEFFAPQVSETESSDLKTPDVTNTSYPNLVAPDSPVSKPVTTNRNWIQPLILGIWLTGFAILWLHSMYKVLRLKKRISKKNCTSWNSDTGIAEINGLRAPFLFGLFHPIIYLPADIADTERTYIIAHETYHRKRKDYICKILAFAVTSIHWFNPLVWFSYRLFCIDMEISCDEAVLQKSNVDIKKKYASSLLRYAAGLNGYTISPLTFGEPDTKSRIKNVLKYHKKVIGLSIIAVIGVICVSVGLMLRPYHNEANKKPSNMTTDDATPASTNTLPTPVPITESPDNMDTSYYGNWKVTDFYPSKVTALSTTDMEHMMNILCVYEDDHFSSDDDTILAPEYLITTESKSEFEQGCKQQITFDSLGISSDKISAVEITNSGSFGSYFYVKDSNTLLIAYEGVLFKAERTEVSDFKLTEDGKELLSSLCYSLPDFDGLASMNEAFWKDFIFFTYTGYFNQKYLHISNADSAIEEGIVKVSKQQVTDYVKLLFGTELPDYTPAYEDMDPGQTLCYYKDGYYYIGASDFPDYTYSFQNFELHQERFETYAFVTYNISFEGQDNAGTITFTLYPADNETGFVIIGKETIIQSN